MNRLMVVIGLICLPVVARADFGIGDWLSGQNNILIEQLITQLRQLTELRNTVIAVQRTAQAGNEVLSFARVGYKQFQAIRRFNLKDALSDAKWHLTRAFPELGELEKEIKDIEGQISINDGDFFRYNGRRDGPIYDMMNRLFNYEYQSTIWPMFFKGMERHGGEVHIKPNEINQEIMRMYMNTGQLKDWAMKRTVIGSLAAQANEFVKQAQAKEEQNIELLATTANTQILSQMLSNSTEFTDLYKYQVAAEEKARRIEQGRRNAINKGVGKYTKRILEPGTFWKEAGDE